MNQLDGPDVIAALAAHEITLDEAEARTEQEIERWRRGEIDDWCSGIGMSAPECTASAHGATLDMVARLRRDGWPTSCCRCGGAIDYLTDLWMLESSEDGRDPLLVHLADCPMPRLAEPLCPEHPQATMQRLIDDAPALRSERHELESVLRKIANGGLDPSQAMGYVESVYEGVVSDATITAYERVYGRRRRVAPDDRPAE